MVHAVGTTAAVIGVRWGFWHGVLSFFFDEVVRWLPASRLFLPALLVAHIVQTRQFSVKALRKDAVLLYLLRSGDRQFIDEVDPSRRLVIGQPFCGELVKRQSQRTVACAPLWGNHTGKHFFVAQFVGHS